MSDKIDEILDRLIKGGPGSGKRGHKSGPASDINRELDPSKKKKILASDKRSAKKEVKDHSPEELQSKIDSHKEMSENKFLSPASRESYAAKHKVLVAHQKKQGKAVDIKRPEVGIASKPGPFGNINKGGPGSGRKGHKTPKQELKSKADAAHKRGDMAEYEKLITQVRSIDPYKGDPASGRKGHKTPKQELKSKADAAHKRGDMAEYEKLITQVRSIDPYKGDPASEAVSPTSHGTKPAGKGKYGVGGGKFASPAHEGASAAMNDRRKANTEKYLKQLESSLSLETDPERKASFEKDIKEIKGELKTMNTGDEAHDIMSSLKAPGVGKNVKKSLETLFHMQQLANQGRLDPSTRRKTRKMRKSIKDRILEKKQGVPKGVDPAKHERCVLDVKADGQDKSSAYAICNSSMKKADGTPRLPASTDIDSGGSSGPSDDWYVESVTDRGVSSPAAGIEKAKKEKMEKVLPVIAGAKAAGRVINSAIKSPDAGAGSDKVPGGPGGPSAAAGGGTGSGTGPSAPTISKSLAKRLLEMRKGGIGSGRKGHHSIGQDYSDASHDSVFEDSPYDSTQEREIFNDNMKEALDREEKRAEQRIKEKESTAKRGVSRKPKKEAPKKSLLQRFGQAIIDKI